MAGRFNRKNTAAPCGVGTGRDGAKLHPDYQIGGENQFVISR